MSFLKTDFATVRQLEKKTRVFFEWGVGLLAVGLVCTFILGILGGVLLLVGAVTILAGIVWTSVLGKEASKSVFCPYCTSKNDVYQSIQLFDCDICKRPIKFSADGEAMRVLDIGTDLAR